MAPELLEPVWRPRAIRSGEHDTAVGGPPEIHLAPGTDAQEVTDSLRDGYLSLRRYGRGHVLTAVMHVLIQVLPSGASFNRAFHLDRFLRGQLAEILEDASHG